MAIKYRHLSRSSAHRQALLRNLVTALIEHEAISTSFAKAKEAQRLAEKLITLGKKNTGAAKNKAQQIFYEPHKHMDKLFGPLRLRYESRPGGYTRVLKQEPTEKDNAPSAILCLVDGPRDIRFDMTVRAIAREQALEMPMREMTAANVRKVTRFRPDGIDVLEQAVKDFATHKNAGTLDRPATATKPDVLRFGKDKYGSLKDQNEKDEERDEDAADEDEDDAWEDIPTVPETVDREALKYAAERKISGLRVGGSRKARRAAYKRRLDRMNSLSSSS
ncbi:hypothetical protein B0A52_04990 [Exophiala mesophila]|uniref:Large ribosomal subunit protein bL17m n=1 Tax=Exophiala mesophila TaxID=212818 RepID=A0A438N6L7_EXOME|nr:hypothetical protein B0A52_04990 [Exophiala mesophila]